MSALQDKKVFPAPILENIPDELKAPEVRRWVVWKLTEVKDTKGKAAMRKLPYQALNGYLAKADDPKTWCSFDEAVKAYTEKRELTYTEKGKKPLKLQGGPSGLGFQLGFEQSNGKTYFGVDLDGLTTPEKWQWANKIIKALDSYGEISPSGKGVHVLGRGKKGPEQIGVNNRRAGVEVYDKTHYFTVSGNHIEGTPLTLNDREEELRAFHASIWSPKENHKEGREERDKARAEKLGSPQGVEPTEPHVLPSSLVALTDEEIKGKLLSEKGAAGDKARDLYISGLYQLHFPDDSEDGGDWSGADLSLMSKIEFYCIGPSDEENALQLDRVFSGSALAKREKWTQAGYAENSYRQATIGKAIAHGKEPNAKHWSPNYGKAGRNPRRNSGKSKGGKSFAAKVVDTILETYTLRTVRENKAVLMREENGLWREVSDLEIGAIAQQIGGRDKMTPSVRADIFGKIQHENLISITDFERRPDLFMDGEGKIFSSITREVIDPKTLPSDVFVLHKIAAVFDPEAPVPKDFLDGLELSLPNEQERLTFQEHGGSGFYRKMLYDSVYCILGDKRNSKTTLFSILIAVVGIENVSNVTLPQLGQPYHTYNMWRKMFNINDDITNEPLRKTDFFKKWTGGAPVTIMKKYHMPVDVLINAAGFFGCNLMPPAIEKNDQAYYERWLLASAPNLFLLENKLSKEQLEKWKDREKNGFTDGFPRSYVEPNVYRADPDYLEKITGDPKKLSGILNWFLEGLARLMKNKHYTLSLTPEENRERYDNMAGPQNDIELFIHESGMFRRQDTSLAMRKADVKWLYDTYCRARKFTYKSWTVFNDSLFPLGFDKKYRAPSNAILDPPLFANEDKDVKRPFLLKGLTLAKDWREKLDAWEELIDLNENRDPKDRKKWTDST